MIGPVEFDLFGADLVARLERTAPVIYEADVCRAAERLETARAFVGNDAGMTHVASYMEVPTVAIFSSTDPKVWQPLGRDVVVLDDRSGSAIDVEQIFHHVTEMSGRKRA